MATPRELRELYKQGVNVSKVLRGLKNTLANDEDIIETTYDVLTGHYIDRMQDPDTYVLWNAFNHELGSELKDLGEITSILEVGVGEATTLFGVLETLGTDMQIYASDISWSRVFYARRWLAKQGFKQDVNLHTAAMTRIPLPASSIDVVYTAHSIEPNGGNERPILKELYRVAKKYLVLVEPAFDLAGLKERQRMVEHGYCTALIEHVGLLGFNVEDHKLMKIQKNPLNPAAITIIKKDSNIITELRYVCPQYRVALEEINGAYFSSEALSVYPIIAGIPCLKPSDAIMASKYDEVE